MTSEYKEAFELVDFILDKSKFPENIETYKKIRKALRIAEAVSGELGNDVCMTVINQYQK